MCQKGLLKTLLLFVTTVQCWLQVYVIPLRTQASEVCVLPLCRQEPRHRLSCSLLPIVVIWYDVDYNRRLEAKRSLIVTLVNRISIKSASSLSLFNSQPSAPFLPSFNLAQRLTLAFAQIRANLRSASTHLFPWFV